MFDIRLLAQRFPIPKVWKLRLNRSFLRSAFHKAAKRAKTAQERERVAWERRNEMGMHEEEENKYYTEKLIRQAARLWVPRPPMFEGNSGNLTPFWAEMEQTGGYALTLDGAKMLREEIRQELRAKHEMRTHRLLWVTTATGILGGISGLIAILSKTHP